MRFEIEITVLIVTIFQKGASGLFLKQGSVKNFR